MWPSHPLLLLLLLIGAAQSKIYFEENFNDDKWESSWITSKHDDKTFGKFEQTAGKFFWG